jgi:hypothetical protein
LKSLTRLGENFYIAIIAWRLILGVIMSAIGRKAKDKPAKPFD